MSVSSLFSKINRQRIAFEDSFQTKFDYRNLFFSSYSSKYLTRFLKLASVTLPLLEINKQRVTFEDSEERRSKIEFLELRGILNIRRGMSALSRTFHAGNLNSGPMIPLLDR